MVTEKHVKSWGYRLNSAPTSFNVWLGVIVLTTVSLIGFSFWWYEYRPSQIKKECIEYAFQGEDVQNVGGLDNSYLKGVYELCLAKHGL